MTSHLPSPRLRRRALFLAVLAASAWPGFAGAASQDPHAAPGASEPLTTDRLIIKYRNGSSAATQPSVVTMSSAHEQVNRAGAQMTRLRSNALSAHVMQLDRAMGTADLHALAARIALADPNVEYAEPDLRLTAQLVPNDPSYLSQWQYYEATAGLNLPTAWSSATGTGVVVAVVDTGYRPHVDLAANILAGYDFVSTAAAGNDGNGRDASALDPGDGVYAGECGAGTSAQASSWHGTHVSGTVAALTNNGVGVSGVAYGAKVLPVRALGKCGGYTSDITDGIIWAAGGTVSGVPANPTPARVINLSLGGSGSCSATFQNAITAARAKGAVLVVAAGNSAGSVANATPANCQGVTAVTAVNRSGARAYYANYGTQVDVAAPGGDMRSASTNGILSTLNSGSSAPGADTYAYYQGTSMATPHVAGVAALMLSRNPALNVDQVQALLRSSVRAFPSASACSGCGTGMIDAGLAVAAAAATPAVSFATLAEVEPNNSLAAPQTVAAANVNITGTLSNSADVDYYKVTLGVGRTLTALLKPAATLNASLVLYASTGTTVASSSNAGNGVEETVLASNKGSAAVTYLVAVRYASGGVGANGSYTLRLSQ